MSKFIDDNGTVHNLDAGNNHFINGKCVNPKSFEDKEIGETLNDYEGVKSLSLVVGHVPNFEYGYGENKVVVNTGEKAW